MVRHTIKTAEDALQKQFPVVAKVVRAEPISALYEQRQRSGTRAEFPELEDDLWRSLPLVTWAKQTEPCRRPYLGMTELFPGLTKAAKGQAKTPSYAPPVSQGWMG